MKAFKLYAVLIGIALTLAACGSAPATAPVVDLNATAESYAATMIAGTLTAIPTATLPPTETATPLATDTPAASPTLEFTNTPEFTSTPEFIPTETFTPTNAPFIGTLAPLGVENLPTCPFLIENETGSKVIVSITGITSPGEKPVYYSYDVATRFMFEMPFGNYDYNVNIDNKKIYTGSFRIYNWDKTTMRISMNKVQIFGP